jgi:hypothetical protein
VGPGKADPARSIVGLATAVNSSALSRLNSKARLKFAGQVGLVRMIGCSDNRAQSL